jgi:hypothetical protein
MDELSGNVNGVAQLANVGLCLAALDKARNRPAHLPGLVTFSGPSGWGKSTAAACIANLRRAYYVEAKSYWTRKAFLETLQLEMGLASKDKPIRKSVARMAVEVAEQLTSSRRPLIIDEMDHLVDRGAVEIVRDLYEDSQAAILLIGEEELPSKLEAWERFAGRVLEWVQAQPAGLEDAQALRALYCHRVAVADDLLSRLVELAHGSVRRICVNLERIQSEALNEGLDSIDLAAWGARPLYTGAAPRRRV